MLLQGMASTYPQSDRLRAISDRLQSAASQSTTAAAPATQSTPETERIVRMEQWLRSLPDDAGPRQTIAQSDQQHAIAAAIAETPAPSTTPQPWGLSLALGVLPFAMLAHWPTAPGPSAIACACLALVLGLLFDRQLTIASCCVLIGLQISIALSAFILSAVASQPPVGLGLALITVSCISLVAGLAWRQRWSEATTALRHVAHIVLLTGLLLLP